MVSKICICWAPYYKIVLQKKGSKFFSHNFILDSPWDKIIEKRVGIGIHLKILILYGLLK